MKHYCLGWVGGLLVMALVGMIGCKDDPEPEESVTTPTETVVPGDDDTDVVEVITPTPSPTPKPDPLSSVRVTPEQATIDAVSSLTFQVSASLASGLPVDTTGAVWSSSDTAVATVNEAGVVTAVAPGITFISATVMGMTSQPSAQLEVVEPGKLEVLVVNAETREPIEGAQVYLGDAVSTLYPTDAEGKVSITAEGEGAFSGPQTVTALHASYVYATLMDVVSRKLVIPLRPVESMVQGTFSGQADFTQMGNVELNQARIGLITRSFFGNPLALDTATIIGPYRSVDICNTPTSIPSNIVGEIPQCSVLISDFVVPGPSGIYDAYMLAGDLDARTVTKWVTDPEIFQNLGKLIQGIPNLYEFSYYFGRDIEVVAPGATTGVVATAGGKTNSAITVEIPTLPGGIDPAYLPVAFAIADTGDRGFLPVGLAGGEGGRSVPVFLAPEFLSYPVHALVMASEQGVGDDGAYVAVMGQLVSTDEKIMLPDFMDLLQVKSLDIATNVFEYYPVAETDVQRSIFSWRFTTKDASGAKVYKWVYWDVYMPESRDTFQLPTLPDTFVPEKIYPGVTVRRDWEFFDYDTGVKTYDMFTVDSELNISDAAIQLERISRNKIYDLAKY